MIQVMPADKWEVPLNEIHGRFHLLNSNCFRQPIGGTGKEEMVFDKVLSSLKVSVCDVSMTYYSHFHPPLIVSRY